VGHTKTWATPIRVNFGIIFGVGFGVPNKIQTRMSS